MYHFRCAALLSYLSVQGNPRTLAFEGMSLHCKRVVCLFIYFEKIEYGFFVYTVTCKQSLAPLADGDRAASPHTLSNTPRARAGSADYGTLLAREGHPH